MTSKFIYILTAAIVLLMPTTNFGQAPNLGTAANFVLFSTVGAVSNTGITHLTGNVGSNSGSSTGFGNVDGGMHDNDLVSGQAGSDLLIAYNQLNSTIPTFFPSPLLGNGQTLIAGVYSIGAASTLNLDLTLDAQGDPNAVFIFQIQGSFSIGANAKVKLLNGAQACKVFWKVEGLVNMASGTFMRGTIIANNAAIIMNSLDTLEGRALSISGAVSVDGILAYTPIGCGSPVLMGPLAPNLASTECYALFTTTGPSSNAGITYVTGDVGSNAGLTTGFNPLFVTGTVHPIPDGSTAACAADLLNVYNYLNVLPTDIELLYPAQFGNNLVLTPHTYILNGAATFTDTLYLNAQGSPNARFVIHIFGALTTSAYSKVILLNGAQSKNIYWVVDGAVQINDYSIFKGTIVCNNGAIDLTTGVNLDGRAMSTTGSLTTAAVTVIMPLGCPSSLFPPSIVTDPVNNQTVCVGDSVSLSVAATGTGLTYQWRKGTVNIIDNGNISGANTATLTFNPISMSDAAANYNVVVIGNASPNDTSTNASIIVNNTSSITSQSSNQVVCAGVTVNLSITTTGSGITYQWRKGTTNLINTSNITGTNTANLVINTASPLDNATNYNVIISSGCLPNITSTNISLTVNTPPTITTEPISQTVCDGNSVSFATTVTGSSLTYQWRNGSTNLINSGNISGATSNVLTINPASSPDTSSYYNLIVSGICPTNDTSDNVSLIIENATSISFTPSGQTVCAGSIVNLSVVVIGTGLTYRWRKGTGNMIDGMSVSGATTASLTINPVTVADAANNYNVVVSGTCPPNDTSLDISLVVNPSPTVYLGSDITQSQLTAPAILDAGIGFTTYLWTTTETSQTIAITQAGTYIVTVTNAFNCADSDTIQVNFTTTSITNTDGSIALMSVYPNPSSGQVYLDITNLETESLQIDVVNMMGSIMYNKYLGSVNGNTIQSFDFTNLSAGMYIMRMTANGKTVQTKLVISN